MSIALIWDVYGLCSRYSCPPYSNDSGWDTEQGEKKEEDKDCLLTEIKFSWFGVNHRVENLSSNLCWTYEYYYLWKSDRAHLWCKLHFRWLVGIPVMLIINEAITWTWVRRRALTHRPTTCENYHSFEGFRRRTWRFLVYSNHLAGKWHHANLQQKYHYRMRWSMNMYGGCNLWQEARRRRWEPGSLNVYCEI